MAMVCISTLILYDRKVEFVEGYTCNTIPDLKKNKKIS